MTQLEKKNKKKFRPYYLGHISVMPYFLGHVYLLEIDEAMNRRT